MAKNKEDNIQDERPADTKPVAVKRSLSKKIFAFDVWDEQRRAAESKIDSPISISSYPDRRKFNEIEKALARPELYTVFATDESRHHFSKIEEKRLNVKSLPRLLAIYWSFRNDVKDEPCLVLSIGEDRASCGLIVNGKVESKDEENAEISLNGILRRFVESNGPLKRGIEKYKLRDAGIEADLYKSFRLSLRTGQSVSVERISIIPPFDFSSSLDAINASLNLVDPDGLARTIIVTDWGAAHCNLPDLLNQGGRTVLSPASNEAFNQAVKGLSNYGFAETRLSEGLALNIKPEKLFYPDVQVGASLKDKIKIKNTTGGWLKARVTSKAVWLKTGADTIQLSAGAEKIVSVDINTTSFAPGSQYKDALEIECVSGIPDNPKKVSIEVHTAIPPKEREENIAARKSKPKVIVPAPPVVKLPPPPPVAIFEAPKETTQQEAPQPAPPPVPAEPEPLPKILPPEERTGYGKNILLTLAILFIAFILWLGVTRFSSGHSLNVQVKPITMPVTKGDLVVLKAQVENASKGPLLYTWKTTSGTLEGGDSEVGLNTSGINVPEDGTYVEVSVSVTDSQGAEGTARQRIYIQPEVARIDTSRPRPGPVPDTPEPTPDSTPGDLEDDSALKTSTLSIVSSIDVITVTIDNKLRMLILQKGGKPVRLSPGQHHIVATKPGYKTWEGSVYLDANSKDRIVIDMEPEEPSPAQRASEQLAKAESLFRQRQYDAAIAACDEGLRYDPSNQALRDKKNVIERTKQILSDSSKPPPERERGADSYTPPVEPRPSPQPERLVPPVKTKDAKPVYPDLARRMRLTGTVVVRVFIDENGRVASAKALSGPALLQQAAVDAAKQWQYSPARRGNEPVKYVQEVTFSFTIYD